MVLASKDEASKTSAKNEAWLSRSFQDLSKIFPRSFPIKAEATNQVTAEPDQNRSAMQAMRLLGSQLGITALHRSLSVRDELQQFIQA